MPTPTPAGPIAQKLLKILSRAGHRKALDLSPLNFGSQSHLHPLHAHYSTIQHRVSELVEVLLTLPALGRFSRALGDAEDLYKPSGPPMSPLTYSYFFYWSVFDMALGLRKETLGSCLIAVLERLGRDPALLAGVRTMQASRMGLHEHQGWDGDSVVLRDMGTDEPRHCLVASQYRGEPGQIWLARVLPPPSEAFRDHLMITTPYVFRETPTDQWRGYLQRTLPGVKSADPREAYHRLMKYGLSLNYWNEFIFQAYSNYQTEAAFLTGLPDIPLSRPHSPETNRRIEAGLPTRFRDG